ncbi:MAG: hypothetical protein JRG91_18225, partial [Deltaproteobacteria bacterium]|nr:hypothetical protein [Deltaproteobacteria bacterium]
MCKRLLAVPIVLVLACSCGGGSDPTGDAGADADAADDVDAADAVDAVDDMDDAADAAPDGPCTVDGDCDNGDYCDGEETCVDGACAPGDEVICDDSDECTRDACDEATDACVFTPLGVSTVAAGTRVSDTTGDSEIPALAWTGSEIGVAWLDGVIGATTVQFARVSAAGAVVGSPVQISEGSDHFPLAQIDLAWTGSEYAAVWLAVFGADSSMRVLMARMGADGTVTGTESQVTGETSLMLGPAIAWADSEFGIGWSDYRASSDNTEIYFARYAPDGAKIGADVHVPFAGDNEKLADLAWSGSEYGLLWHEYVSGPPDIHFTRLAADGSIVGSTLAVTETDSSSSLSRSLVWTGSEYGAAWMYSESGDTDGAWDVYFGRISAGGAKVGTDVQVSSSPATFEFPPIAWNGSAYTLGWTASGGAATEIEIAVVAADGTPAAPIAVTADDGFESGYPAVAGTDGEIAVGWKDARHGSTEIYLSIFGSCE